MKEYCECVSVTAESLMKKGSARNPRGFDQGHPYFFGAQVQNDRKGPYSHTKTVKTVYFNLKNHHISVTKNIQYIS
jgi:hypothetical protein